MDPDPDLLANWTRARGFERSGDPARALEIFSHVAALLPREPLPRLRVASVLRATGDPAGARRSLEAALATVERGRRELWEAWWAVEPDVARFERAARPSVDDAYGVWMRESLVRWEAEGALRIDCGGDRLVVAADGAVWLSDRFSTAGFRRCGEAGEPPLRARDSAATEVDVIYRTARAFESRILARNGRPGYRIPVPAGQLRVRLHFVELQHRAVGARAFEVALEGRAMIPRLDIFAEVGRARPLVRELEVDASDGFLDVEFVHGEGEPRIAAIEIERGDRNGESAHPTSPPEDPEPSSRRDSRTPSAGGPRR